MDVFVIENSHSCSLPEQQKVTKIRHFKPYCYTFRRELFTSIRTQMIDSMARASSTSFVVTLFPASWVCNPIET